MIFYYMQTSNRSSRCTLLLLVLLYSNIYICSLQPRVFSVFPTLAIILYYTACEHSDYIIIGTYNIQYLYIFHNIIQHVIISFTILLLRTPQQYTLSLSTSLVVSCMYIYLMQLYYIDYPLTRLTSSVNYIILSLLTPKRIPRMHITCTTHSYNTYIYCYL